MKVKFSVLTPLFNTPEQFLRDMIESVQNQTYQNWELCLADASDGRHGYVGEIAKGYALKDARIKYIRLEKNKGISENTNACIDLSTGNYFALLDHDDILDKRALKEAELEIRKKQADFIYSDEAKFTKLQKEWFAPNYKPDFSREELRAHNYICHLTVYSRKLLEETGRYQKEYDGSQDHDMVLRLSEHAKRIVHIPQILYYWRVHENSVSSGVENKSYAVSAAKRAVSDHIARCGEAGSVANYEPFPLIFHVQYDILEKPLVTVVLYGAADEWELMNQIEKIETFAGYGRYEYLILSERADEQLLKKYFDKNSIAHPYALVRLPWTGESQKINEALNRVSGDYLLFLGNGCCPKTDNFITELLRQAQRASVAFAGGRIITDKRIKSAGIALCRAAQEKVILRFQGEDARSFGYEAGLCHTRNVSAVSLECCIVGKKKFQALGGFHCEFMWYRGIDLCLRAREKGFENVWTPYSEAESASSLKKPDESETRQFARQWRAVLREEDPYYNRNIRYDLDEIHDKNTIFTLCQKGTQYLRQEGLKGLRKRIAVYRKSGCADFLDYASVHLSRPAAAATVFGEYRDVLFINGCAPSVPHPPRYRVTHQREQLAANRIYTEEIYYENLNPDLVKYYRTFIFFRCPYTDQVGELIKRAKELHKLVLFDIDDLVVDTKYTDTIPYVMSLNKEEKAVYDDGVTRMGKTLKLCDAAITTTERLAKELSYYVPEVFINRNRASERMYELSEKAIRERDVLPFVNAGKLPDGVTKSQYAEAVKKAEVRRKSGVRIGYFSGSITHNEDFEMIKPALIQILREFPTVTLHLAGELDLPKDLTPFQKQITAEPFADWERLPQMIASVDINLAPITRTIFNEAKSENKWTEAALVKVVTVASNVGAFSSAIRDGETGILCSTQQEWHAALKKLVLDRKERERLGQSAYEDAVKNYITIHSGQKLAQYIQRRQTGNLAFVLPSTEISGGIMVAIKHADVMRDHGADVFFINDGEKSDDIVFHGKRFPVLSLKNTAFQGKIDSCVATMWTTSDFLQSYFNTGQKYYLVQGYETGFYGPNHPLRLKAEQTYHLNSSIKYLTVSKWCEKWLKEDYGKTAGYIPNGIDCQQFYPCERRLDGKIRILIEGDSSVSYKNVDESFQIAEKLDKARYEIWYLSYNGKPKTWYCADRFFNKVPHERVADIYRQCHILLKSSILESFSYPPLEMMATGGLVVAVLNNGNAEFLKDGENCLLYQRGDLDAAVRAIESLAESRALREKLRTGGLETAKRRSWDRVGDLIIKAYGNK